MDIKINRTLPYSTDDVWGRLAEEFASISKWVPAVTSSRLDGPMQVGANRTCVLDNMGGISGEIRENVTGFDRSNKRLQYKVISGLPPMVEVITNTWVMTPAPNNSTELKSDIDVVLKWWAKPLAPVMKPKLTASINGMIDKLDQSLAAA